MKKTSSMILALATITTMCLSATAFTSCCRNGVRTEVRVLEREEWIGMLDGTLGDLTLRLNNYTPNYGEFDRRAERAFFKPDDSFLSIGSLGISYPFEIPVQRSRPYSLYMNDVNSTGVSIEARRGGAVISIEFEDDGSEIIGNCVNDFSCFCGDPSINLNGLKIDIPIALQASGGELVISRVDARLESTFEESGPCVDNVCAFACDIFAPDRESNARNSIQERVVDFFNHHRGLIEGLLNEHLRRQGVTQPIKSATVGDRGELHLIVQYPDETCE